MSDEHKITKKDLNKVFWHVQTLNITANYQSMQAPGFLYCMVPILKKLYGDKPKELRVKAMKRHLEFFNSHVNSDALILGITAAVEETTSEDEKETVTSIKTGLMGPLAGLGDSILKFTWLPICGSIGASLGLTGNILGPILMFLLYNIVNITTKYYGIQWGYSKGMDLINGSQGNVLQRVANMANVVGLMVVGALIATVVKVKVVAKITAGKDVISLQSMFDKILPGLFSLLVTIGVYFILKKTNGKHAPLIIISIMVISVILSVLGIIGA
ncbi:PTS system mannose/fructose/sorbose family transporter subunit IID [Lactobacillus sp. ESL0677]|uniref:PTS system mannose/fructose/sorbose family transporter subunit IID n=1 Tax=Lactobacillus sp. ESL0677 TaxID=2983208 RepID=UPI0023F70017|nr:PTS system mannose/fructose/sorbose family transporter subunit IID [Lactobacillus sp. ESL0677]WEV37652.1 PTS system mannose/fructose/sorbose family transporter subunit IID [Lactobacillus sp. ESL0677]